MFMSHTYWWTTHIFRWYFLLFDNETLLFKCVTYCYGRRMLSKCPENNQKTTCFVVSPYHLIWYLKSFCFFIFCPGDKLYSQCPCCPISCVALVLNWFVTVHLVFCLNWLAGVAYLVAFPEFTVRFLYFPFLTIVVSSCLENRSVHTSQLRQHYTNTSLFSRKLSS